MVTWPTKSSACFRFGDDFALDLRAYQLSSGGVPLKLKPAPMQLLILLVEHRGELVTREQIVERIWGKETFVDSDNGINVAISKIRQVLRDDPERPRFVLTVPGKGYRFVAPVEEVEGVSVRKTIPEIQITGGTIVPAENKNRLGFSHRKKIRNAAIIFLAMLLLGAFAALGYYHSRRANGLSEQDTIVIADFTNNTGDPVFDESLTQALSIELTQSPFLKVASGLQVGEILRRMGRSTQEPLTRELSSEICLRMGGKAFLSSSISALGSRYIVGVEALSCSNGQTLAAAQAQAENKEDVLKVIGEVASQIRVKIGESLPSIQKYDFPVNATTTSLEALKAFSMGLKAERESGPLTAIPFYQEAIQRDPDFALAYATLGRAYEDFGQDEEAVRNYSEAFRLRDRLSEREKHFVTTLYYETVPGSLSKAKEAGELWIATYPRDTYGREKLGTVYSDLGELRKADDQFREALRLDPESEVNAFNAVLGAINVGRLDEADRILQTAKSKGADGEALHVAQYLLAFQRREVAEMEKQVAWALGKPGTEEILLAPHSETQAYLGKIRDAGDFSKRATESAIRDKATEMAALYQVVASLREIEVGNVSLAGGYVRRALSLAPTRDVKIQAALAWARSGNATRARELLKEVQKNNPENTLVNSYWAPAIEASLEIQRGNPEAALSKLQIVAPYELSQAPPAGDDVFMYPTYTRGQAYLAAHNGGAAITEFKKIVDHPGVMLNCILGALAPLQLARAEVMAGDTISARRDYQEFLTLWKDADPDVPILKQAKAEYAKIQ
jgi:eukaryotic-like serine/threonine-protein kinase